MIEKIRTVGFKGFDIDEPVPQKVIYCGKNKSGKSTRAGAIAIALFGHIPFSTAGKKPGDILNSFGRDHLVVAVTIKGIEFARKFSINAKGGVSQVLLIEGKKKSSEAFAIALDKAGAPKIADVAEFMKQSEAKKVDTLFDLYPNDTLAGIDTEITEAKEDVSRIEKKITGAESTIQRLTDSKSKIELPSGSIAEVQAEIKNIDTQIADIEKQINEAKVNQAKIEGEKIGKEEAEKKSLQKMESLKQKPEIKTNDGDFYGEGEIMYPAAGRAPDNSGGHAFIDGGYPEINDRFASDKEPFKTDLRDPSLNPSESIKRIIGALKGSGCNTCAALIVAKQELKKYV